VAISLLIGAVLLAAVLMRVDWTEMRTVLAECEPWYVVPIVATMLIHYVFKGLRWRILLAARAPVARLLAVRLTYVGYFMNNLLPARAGELGRPYLLSLARPDLPFSFTLATLFGDKMFDLGCLLLLLLISFTVVPLPDGIAHGMMAAAAACCALLAIGGAAAWWHAREQRGADEPSLARRLTQRLGRRGERVYKTMLTFAEGLAAVTSLRRLVLATFHSLMSFAFLAAMTWCCLRMVGLQAGILESLFVIGLVGLSFLIPAPPTNVGNIHFFGTQAVLLLGIGDLERAFAFSVLLHLNQVVTVSAAGVISLAGLDWRRLRDLSK